MQKHVPSSCCGQLFYGFGSSNRFVAAQRRRRLLMTVKRMAKLGVECGIPVFFRQEECRMARRHMMEILRKRRGRCTENSNKPGMPENIASDSCYKFSMSHRGVINDEHAMDVEGMAENIASDTCYKFSMSHRGVINDEHAMDVEVVGNQEKCRMARKQRMETLHKRRGRCADNTNESGGLAGDSTAAVGNGSLPNYDIHESDVLEGKDTETVEVFKRQEKCRMARRHRMESLQKRRIRRTEMTNGPDLLLQVHEYRPTSRFNKKSPLKSQNRTTNDGNGFPVYRIRNTGKVYVAISLSKSTAILHGE